MRHRFLLAATAASFLVAGPLAAQTTTTPDPTTPPTVRTAPPVADGAAPRSEVNRENSVHVVYDGGPGLRSSRLIGASVYNGAGDDATKIGNVDDLILSSDKNARTAILSVGGFLGMGAKLVAVPFEQLRVETNGRVVLPGATADGLKAQPDFAYRVSGS